MTSSPRQYHIALLTGVSRIATFCLLLSTVILPSVGSYNIKIDRGISSHHCHNSPSVIAYSHIYSIIQSNLSCLEAIWIAFHLTPVYLPSFQTPVDRLTPNIQLPRIYLTNLARIRLEHRYLTKSYLLNREDRPAWMCRMCLPIDSSTHHDRLCRIRLYTKPFFFDVRNMKDLFDSVTPSTILLYVRATGLFSRCDLTSYLGLCTHLTITFFSSGLCLDS